MTCCDCEMEGRLVTFVYDLKHGGNVCPRCHRVFSPTLAKGNFHYTDKKSAFAAMEKRREKMGTCNRALVDLIMAEGGRIRR